MGVSVAVGHLQVDQRGQHEGLQGICQPACSKRKNDRGMMMLMCIRDGVVVDMNNITIGVDEGVDP